MLLQIIWGLIILPVKCNTYLEKGGHKMNEVFEKLSEVFEELRSEADEREYSIQTEETKKADKELKKANWEYEKFLSELSAEQRIFLENYMDIVLNNSFTLTLSLTIPSPASICTASTIP